MKRIIETEESAGFESMLGESIIILCGVYHYAGVLSGVNADHLELSDPKLVYETGGWDAKEWKDAQALPAPWRVMLQGIEAWGPGR